ncbi:hypothetical protein JCM15457_927 [Liquorilactobacillus sucicola DSM 21376 = JCM 15457]|uniref:Uncharacterized protein n=1 Tax=Liquorilactobacillus sucicola DSM 21376 = JCM 15457 TaxID=1423806 RepID=A0A023CW22_9LACO|nr:hypothetical protein [Liquorilactobacillus sucicola]KRN06093.1 hypothetical protein FD15_GL001283 [Liquorilactobacillus sucicola DSM 21376 = JCM 15457]GAJ26019.1 hypothetical protein JCM15457_927 [Liquorilactobacillus sucicola DSM 21376 = JCM 15457]
MNKQELQEYINNNSRAVKIFWDKALVFQQAKNKKRQPAKRWNETMLERAADKMLATFITGIHDKLKMYIKEDALAPQKSWANFIEDNEILEELEESVVEMDFS